MKYISFLVQGSHNIIRRYKELILLCILSFPIVVLAELLKMNK